MDKLALYIYPIPDGTEYGSKELSNPQKVIELFDYCQILEAVISKQGWEYLIDYYGYENLFRINQESGWFDCSSIEELISYIKSEKEISPGTL